MRRSWKMQIWHHTHTRTRTHRNNSTSSQPIGFPLFSRLWDAKAEHCLIGCLQPARWPVPLEYPYYPLLSFIPVIEPTNIALHSLSEKAMKTGTVPCCKTAGLFLLGFLRFASASQKAIYTNHFFVEFHKAGEAEAKQLAAEYGFNGVRKVRSPFSSPSSFLSLSLSPDHLVMHDVYEFVLQSWPDLCLHFSTQEEDQRKRVVWNSC